MELALLERRLKRSALLNFFMSLMGMLMLTSVLYGLIFERASLLKGKDGGLIVLVIPGSLVFAWVMLKRAREFWPAHESVVYRALSDDSRDLVWLHLTTGMFSALTLNFRNGEFYRVHANEEDKRTLLAFAMRRAPHAILGYGDAERKAYRALVKAATAGRPTQ